MKKRERIDQFLNSHNFSNGVPAAFFQHFESWQRHGVAAVNAQLSFFLETDVDIMKIMFDDIYPKITNISKASDWTHIPSFSIEDDVFTEQLSLIKRIVHEVHRDAYIFQTIFSPFVSAGCSVSPIPVWDKVVTQHFKEDPEAMTKGLTKIAYLLGEFANRAVKAGVDGFYVSLQGGEYDRFTHSFFNDWLKPLDIMLLSLLQSTGAKIILHICGTDIRLSDYIEYPGDVVNMACKDNNVTLSDIVRDFKRPVMGGLPNKDIIETGDELEVKQTVIDILREAPSGVMLGADCTLGKNVSRQRIRLLVDTAHNYQG